MPDKDQKFIYNKSELALIKSTFANNDELLYAIRNVFLQLPLTEQQKNLVKQSVTEPVYNVLRKRILPDMSPEFPLTQIPSILTTLTNDLKTKSVEEMKPLFSAKATEIAYLEQQFATLKDLDTEQELKLADFAVIDGKSVEESYIGLTAYLFILGYIDPMLNFIKSIAGQVDETPEEQEARLSRNSTQ